MLISLTINKGVLHDMKKQDKPIEVVAFTQNGEKLSHIQSFDINEVINACVIDAVSRRERGSMQGKTKKDGTSDQVLRGSELEFFCGVFSAISRIRTILEGTEEDDRGQYFPPALVFSGLRGDSCLDSMIEAYLSKQDKKVLRVEVTGSKAERDQLTGGR